MGKKILQYNRNGTYENVFTTGFQFLRLTTRNNLLYVTILLTKNVRVYDAANGNIVNHFDVTTNDGRGLAFDKDGRLHISTYGPTVEVFTSNGHKISQRTYSQLELGDGLVIDSHGNTIITDRSVATPQSPKVLIYNNAGTLIKKIAPFLHTVDVALGYECNYLIVADWRQGIFLL